ncbi:MAG TPA: BamA/TamA family outer membrane protein [Longimicrobiaceae bacterium]
MSTHLTGRRTLSCLATSLAAAFGATPLHSQDSVTVVPGPQYEAGKFQRWLLGDGYRELWTQPIRVEVFDFRRVHGGLVPVERGGNIQTKALRFRAPDGTEYNFRSVDKELTPALPEYARETVADWVRQDITSAQMPLAPIIATPLLDAVGVLNPAPKLVVLADVPELGEFREEYGGMLGTFEAHPDEVDEGKGFAGSVEVEDTEGMLEEIEDDPSNRVDARTFLTARLVDMLIGDWDRHDGQWRWARYDRDGQRWWVPIPEDRDYAFVDYGGFVARGARMIGVDRLISFDPEYPSVEALMANSVDLNRRILAELPRSAWDSVAAFVQGCITDKVIDDALTRLPSGYGEETAEAMRSHLRARRDRLHELADAFYASMTEMVEIHATDADEVAHIERRADGSVEVDIQTREGTAVYRRRFHPTETAELRIDLHGGDDQAVIDGPGREVVVRVMGGGGDDHLADKGRGRSAFYDDRGENRFEGGRRTRVDTRSYEPPEEVGGSLGLLPSRDEDWGSSLSIGPTGDWRSHVGVVVGAELSRTRYAFRHRPYEAKHSLTALVSPLSGRGALEYRAALPREGSARWLELRGDLTTMNAVRFNGFGNNSEGAGSVSRVWLRELSFGPVWHVPLSPATELVTGLLLLHTDPRYMPGSPVAAARPFGSESLGRAHATAGLEVDSRDSRWFPTRGFDAEVIATFAPPVWDITSPYSRLEASAATYLPLPLGSGPVLALRGGGARAWGDFPFQESAFLGGSHSLRGFERERFAGEAMVFGNAELRVPLVELELLLRGDLGISGLVDAGRVFVDGESPGGWHHAQGGSIWFMTPAVSVSFTYARGEDHEFYVDFGLPF